MKGLRAALAFCLALAPLGCSHAPKPAANPEPEPPAADELIIISTSDFHSSLDRAEGLAHVVRELRRKFGEHVLHLDGGDLFQGSLEGNLTKGRSIVDFYNALGVDAAAFGNHDFDFGPKALGRVSLRGREDGMGNIKERERQARFKWLSANLVRTSGKCTPGSKEHHCNALGQRTVFEPHAIFERAGRRVCVIGATTPTTTHIQRPAFLRGTSFEELAPVIEAEARFLRGTLACQTVILTAHAGLLCEAEGKCQAEGDRAEMLRLLRALPPRTLDAVVAGHTHLLAQEVINGTPVLEAGQLAKAVGILRLAKAGARFEPFVTVPEKADEPDVTRTLEPYRKSAQKIRARVVGKATAPFTRIYHQENPTANLVADAVYAAAKRYKADFALINGGGLRNGLPAGTLTFGDLFATVPFANSLAIAELTGAELRRMLEIAFSGGHAMPGISGLRVKRLDLKPGERGPWDRDLNGDGKKEDWERAALLEITDEQGNPLKDDKRYRLATDDYLVIGGDHQKFVFDQVPKNRIRIFEDTGFTDLLARYIERRGTVSPTDYYDPAHPRIQNIPPK
jgi:5'-nucleotidase